MSESTFSTEAGYAIRQFPVLKRVLNKYFPDNALDLIDRYHRVGESSVEFAGLADEIKEALQDPAEGAAFLNNILGTQLDPAEAEEHLIGLHDQLTRSGIFSDEFEQAERERQLEEKASPDELLNYYLRRNITLPGFLHKLSGPLWAYPAVAVGAATISAVIMNFIPPEVFGGQVIRSVLLAIILVSTAVIFASVVTMNGLRGERLHPERERQKDKDFQEATDGGKTSSRNSLIRRLNIFS